jgi:hypothetical protein
LLSISLALAPADADRCPGEERQLSLTSNIHSLRVLGKVLSLQNDGRRKPHAIFA